jgi:hypothetical protein
MITVVLLLGGSGLFLKEFIPQRDDGHGILEPAAAQFLTRLSALTTESKTVPTSSIIHGAVAHTAKRFTMR